MQDVKVYAPGGEELPPDGSFFLWDGSGCSLDSGSGIVFTPMSDIEMYLAASPGTLSSGIYIVTITDSNGNLFTTYLYHEPPTETTKPTGLSQTINADNSITLSWTNLAGISAPGYVAYIFLFSDDANGDGLVDSPLIASRNPPTNSYTIPASFVQNTLVGKTGLTWSIEIRQQTTSPVAYPDGTSSIVISIDADGVVTISGDSSFKGVMTADKSIIFGTATSQSTYQFRVIMLSGQTFTQSDLAGTWRTHELTSGSQVDRRHATLTMNAAGAGEWTDMVRTDSSTPGPVSLTLDASGGLQDSNAEPGSMFLGTMSAGKNIMCVTNTENSSEYWMALAVK